MSQNKTNRTKLILIYSLQGGGVERTLVNLLNRLGDEVKEVLLVVGVAGGVLEKELPADVECRYLFRSDFLARVCFWLFRRAIFRSPLKMLWNQRVPEHFDFMVSFLDCFLTDLVAGSTRTEKKVCLVRANYESDPDFGLSSLSPARRKWLIENRYRPLDRIAFVSRSARDGFVNSIAELSNFEILPILFSPEEVRRRAEEQIHLSTDAFMQPECFQFVCVGRLVPVKGHDLLIDACGILMNDGCRFHLHLVGDGPCRESLQQQVERKGLSSYVTFHGFQKNPYPIVAMADAKILPSISEAMPTVICEALVLGVPVLGSDCPGCKDILNDGEYGVVFKRDKNDLAKKMKDFIQSPDLVEGWRKRGNAWASSYNEDVVLDRYRRLIGLSPI